MSSSPTSALGPSDNPWDSSPTIGHAHEPTYDASDFEFQDVDLPSPSPPPSPSLPTSTSLSPPPPSPPPIQEPSSTSSTSPSSTSRPSSKGPPPTLNRGVTGETETSGSNFDLSLKSPDGFGSFDSKGVVLAVLLVNFNHLLGPVIEFSHPPNILSSPSLDPELAKLLPFLALPDGAHLQEEDYSYFHTVSRPQEGHPPGTPEEEPFPINQTVFGISCNRQLAASELLNRPTDVTRSTVQMAVVVLARQPVFGPIRDKLGVVTRAFFAQRDFTSTDILVDFYSSLQSSLRGQVSETTMHMGTSLRELIHKFRHKTLILLKLMLLQKKIMFFGYPVERLCTYQYTLVSLIPGLLMSLNDCGSPKLDTFAASVEQPTSLKTSDRPSLLRFFGFPLNIFGKDAFFQPYLPLQQIDMCKCSSWLLGTTNSIMLQQRDAAHDCLVNIEHTSFEFADPKLERLVALTAADRRWMDDVVRTVEETWNPQDPTRPIGMVFRGSDDFLRAKFEEYLCSLLSSMKYADFLTKSPKSDPLIANGGGNFSQSLAQFSTPWVKEFRATTAFQSWDMVTDPVLFDIWEPKHPCEGKTNPVTDIGLRLAEGLHDLNLEQNLGPTKDALASAFSTGSTSFLRAFEGVRSGISSQLAALPSPPAPSSPSFPGFSTRKSSSSHPLSDPTGGSSSRSPGAGVDLRAAVAGFGSFWGSKVSKFAAGGGAPSTSEKKVGEALGEELVPVDLDAKRAAAANGR